ncbi:LPO_1073/Vpar_1526 family protein [Pseudacidovorax intermedius]|uniref:LPO_1073/Vpar_1526 family protein n=1 Tax=Pseudacidovorax intermedius TaxID=433924 RepID=UPI0012DD6225|nr:LPO_1073/Vpar_1526 family protein [Pseudacidovorax intermedius]
MINDKNLTQEGGNDSTNYQAHSITINQGISYEQAEKIALSVYRENFLQMSQDAASTALHRAEKITQDFLQSLNASNEQALQSMRNPSMQAALYNAQKAYAITGDNDLEGVLVNILVERAAHDKRTIQQITLDESIIVAPKLTFEQMDALTLNFLFSRTSKSNVRNIKDMTAFLRDEVAPFVSSAKINRTVFEHLEYAGCGSFMDANHLRALPEIFRIKYKGIFSRGGSAEDYASLLENPTARENLLIRCLRDSTLLQICALTDSHLDEICANNALPPEITKTAKVMFEQHTMNVQEIQTEIVKMCPELEKLFSDWVNTDLSNFSLTTVGIAIARANLKRRTGVDTELGNWIN